MLNNMDKVMRVLKKTDEYAPLSETEEEALASMPLQEQLTIRRAISNCHTKTVVEEVEDERTVGERVADGLAAFAGSWTFIIGFFCVLAVWMGMNLANLFGVFDPYPFILLNLCLSSLAALQAPVIMMSQNRQAAKDRRRAERDLELSVKSELQNQRILKQLGILLKGTEGQNEDAKEA